VSNIEDILPFAKSTPEEAAKNIEGANFLDVGADVFKKDRETFQPLVDSIDAPSEASPSVARFMASSEEHAALVKEDVKPLSYIESLSKSWGSKLKGVDLNRDINELAYEKMEFPEKWNEDKEMDLQILNDERLRASQETYGITGGFETIPGELFSAGKDFGQFIGRNYKEIATLSLAGAGVGVVAGSPGGPVGAITGAAAVGVPALGAAVAATGVLDGYKQQSASMYNELSNAVNEDGTPLTIDDDTKRNISRGVGVLSGLIAGGVTKYVSRSIPYLDKYTNPATFVKQFVLSPKGEAFRFAVLNIGKAVTAGGGGAGLTEMVKILGEEIGGTFNQETSEASLVNGVINFSNNLNKHTNRIAQATKEGGLAAGALSTAGNIISAKVTRDRFGSVIERDVTPGDSKSIPIGPDKPLLPGGGKAKGPLWQEDSIVPRKSDIVAERPAGGDGKKLGPYTPEQQQIDVLEAQDVITHISDVTKKTKAHQVAKDQVSQIRKEALDKAGIKDIYFDKEDLQIMATDEKVGAALRNMIDPSEATASQYTQQVRVDAHKFADVVDDYPTLSEYMKLNPEGPKPGSAKEFLQKMNEAQAKKQELTEQLNAPDATPESKLALQEALDVPQPENNIYSEQDFYNQPTFTDLIRQSIPEAEVKNFDDKVKAARQLIIENIDETAQYEMDQVKTEAIEEATQVEFETQRDRLKDNPNLLIVDKFANYERVPKAKKAPYLNETRYPKDTVASDLTAAHHKKGYSPFAIDPRQLPEDLQHYLNDPVLKDSKVFVKGGVSPDASARMVGVGSGKLLLQILSQTPQRKRQVKAAVDKRSEEIQYLVDESVDLNELAISKAYNAKVVNDLVQMKFMKDHEWPTTKGSIKRIALPLPTIPELVARAEGIVGQIPVKHLKPNLFKVAEKKNLRLAVTAWTKGDFETAFVNKETEALNSLLVKESQVKTGSVNRAIKNFKNFNGPKIRAVFKEAGGTIEKAYIEIMDTFHLSKSLKDTSEQGAYNKYVKKMVQEGNGDVSIPAELSDPKTSVQDLTVNQVLVIQDRLKGLFHQARLKNKLLSNQKKRKEERTIEQITQDVHEKAVLHPDYDPKRVLNPQGAPNPFRVLDKVLKHGEALISNVEHTVLNLDQGVIGGLFNQAIVQPIKGVGEYSDQGFAYKGEMVGQVRDQFVKVIDKTLGQKEFKKMSVKDIFVKEFENYPVLSSGRMRESDLFMMMLNGGNEGNVEARKNYGVPEEVLTQVFDKYLTPKHADLVQGIFDIYESLWPKVAALEKLHKGVTPEKVAAKPWVFQDKVRPGGYFPIIYTDGSDVLQTIKDTLKTFELFTSEDKLPEFQFAEGMTKQGHLKARTGSTRVVSTSMSGIALGFEQLIHDLAMRTPIRDALKLLKSEQFSRDIIAIAGEPAYKMIVSNIIDTASSVEIGNIKAFSESNNFVMKIINGAQSAHAVTVLVGNVASIAIQSASLPFALEKMGPNGLKHIGKILDILATNIDDYADLAEIAAEINPAIRDNMSGVDENTQGTLIKLLGKKRVFTSTDPIKRAQEFITLVGFQGLATVDSMQKFVVTLAGYSQFMAGEAPGWSLDAVTKMDPETRVNRAKGFASSLARLTLTSGDSMDRAAVQKLPATKLLIPFWNDARNSLNNSIYAVRKARQQSILALRALSGGGGGDDGGDGGGTSGTTDGAQDPKGRDYRKAYMHGKSAASAAVAFLVTAVLYKLIVATVRGDGPIDMEDITTEDGRAKMGSKTLSFLKEAPTFGIDRFTENTPVVRDIVYAAFNPYNDRDFKPAGIVATSMTSDSATSLSALREMLVYQNYKHGLSERQLKSSLSTLSYLVGGLPVNAGFKFYKFAKKPVANFIESDVQALSNEIKQYVKNNEGESDIDEEFMEQLKQLDVEINPNRQPTPIPDGAMETIKKLESDGKWYARNPNSTAAGLYQFTQGTWNAIMNEAPELELTENGRVSKDTSQQEKAMKWFTERNMEQLEGEGLPINTESIYSAHFLGIDAAVKVLSAEGDVKLKSLVGKGVLEANGFKNSMKVKDFKSWVKSKVSSAEGA